MVRMKAGRSGSLFRLPRRLLPFLKGTSRQTHVATFDEAITYFTFVFGTAPCVPHDVAQRLLRAEIAETMTSPVDGSVRVAPRYKDLAKTKKDAERVAELERALSEKRIKIWATRHLIQALRLTFAVLVGRWKRSIRTAGSIEDSEEASARVGAQMAALIAEINEAVAERQMLNAIQHAREEDMYQTAYLESEPYLRLNLRNFNFGLFGFAPEREIASGQASEVSLLLHRSGVLQLMIPVRMPKGIEIDEIVDRSIAKGVRLSWTELAEPVLISASKSWGRGGKRYGGDWLPGMHEGARWRRFEHDEPVSLVDLFRVYMDAIENAASLKLFDDWFCYPTLCIDSLGCCYTELEWMARHSNELNGILIRFPGYGRLRDADEITIPINSSIVREESVWHSRASTTRISWGKDRAIHFDDHLWTLLLVENFLLQSWQLLILSTSMQSLGPKPTASAARTVQRQLIFGLDEFYQSSLAYGDAQTIVARLLQESGAERTQAHLSERLDQLGTLVAAERAERAATRATAAAVVAFVAAVAFGLPAIDQTLILAKAVPRGSTAWYLASPLREMAALGAAGSYICYVALLAFILAGLAFFALPRRWPRLRSRRLRPAGWLWDGPHLKVVRTNEIDADVDIESQTTK